MPAVKAKQPASTGKSTPMDMNAWLSLIAEEDLAYEESCLRNAFSLKVWLRYIAFKADAPPLHRIFIYERAVKELPGSYKLWKAYLDYLQSELVSGPPDPETHLKQVLVSPLQDPERWERLNNAFERSLVLCNKFPVIWLEYLRILMTQTHLPTRTRRTFDRALRALPITQHKRIWELYLVFARSLGGESSIRIWRRYLKFEPSEAEGYVNILLHQTDPPRVAEAARCMATMVEDEGFAPKKAESKYALWTDFCDLICEHADELDIATTDMAVLTIARGDASKSNWYDPRMATATQKFNVERILKSGITKYTDQVGKLWNTLAQWWVVRGEFDKARDVYEEAIVKVMTVRDFSIVFDAYAEFEETLLGTRMEALAKGEAEAAEQMDDIDIDLHLARFENLMNRRPFLVNDVVLRQNPHNVSEWQNRVALWKERNNTDKVVETYAKAVETVNPKKAHGEVHMLWVEYAKWHEDSGEPALARQVFERAVKVPFKKVDDLADVWCHWADMELRIATFEDAIRIMGRATTPPKGNKSYHATIRYNDDTLSPQIRLFKSLKLWAFYVDLEESMGSIDSTRVVYDRILELKIATPKIIMQYALFLEEQKWFEDSFKVYERGIELFGYPIAFELWNVYLTKFIKRYGGTKLERTRDLFEHALNKCPPKFSKTLYLMYAKLEEDHGLARHAMRIYDRAAAAVATDDRYDVYLLYLSKATSFFGLPSTREIYERAMETLPDHQAREMALRFSEMETTLGEIDRARAVLVYAAQFSDPRMNGAFWKHWHDFEVKHGNEDTFKEMLRIKRSVQAKYNTDVGFISAQLVAAKTGQTLPEEPSSIPSDPMAALEAEAQQGLPGNKMLGFVKATTTAPPPATEKAEPPRASNPDEIEIDEEDDDDEDEEGSGEDDTGVKGIEKRAIPDAVFGGLAAHVSQDSEEALGARDRLKRKR